MSKTEFAWTDLDPNNPPTEQILAVDKNGDMMVGYARKDLTEYYCEDYSDGTKSVAIAKYVLTSEINPFKNQS